MLNFNSWLNMIQKKVGTAPMIKIHFIQEKNLYLMEQKNKKK